MALQNGKFAYRKTENNKCTFIINNSWETLALLAHLIRNNCYIIRNTRKENYGRCYKCVKTAGLRQFYSIAAPIKVSNSTSNRKRQCYNGQVKRLLVHSKWQCRYKIFRWRHQESQCMNHNSAYTHSQRDFPITVSMFSCVINSVCRVYSYSKRWPVVRADS